MLDTQDRNEENIVGFRLIPSSTFSREHLEEFPVWSEYYDADERDEIIAWGFEPEWIDDQLKRHHDGSDHAVYPLLVVNPFPDRMRLYIRARFRTPRGQNLVGYIVNEDARPAIGIFHDEQEYIFNRGMREGGEKHLSELRRQLPDAVDSVFPLVFETDFTNNDGHRIEGTFDFEVD